MSMASVDDIRIEHDEGYLKSQYQQKPDDYFHGARTDFIDALPEAPDARLLEVGCGLGATGALALKHGRAGHYTGIELDRRAAEEARKTLNEVQVGNVEEMDFNWAPSSFDGLILSEVLEHLIDPWTVMKRLAPLVRPGGLVLASSPNVSHYSIIAEQMKGHWNLTDQGVMDRTHMRWFTPATFRALFEDAGFEVESIKPLVPFGSKARLISRLSANKLDHLFMRQIVVIGRRT